jgi:hypothetical protein
LPVIVGASLLANVPAQKHGDDRPRGRYASKPTPMELRALMSATVKTGSSSGAQFGWNCAAVFSELVHYGAVQPDVHLC